MASTSDSTVPWSVSRITSVSGLVRFAAIERAARRKLYYPHRARTLRDLQAPPGNRLEALMGNRQGQHSIRINARWRVCFRWIDGDAHDVEIVEYH